MSKDDDKFWFQRLSDNRERLFGVSELSVVVSRLDGPSGGPDGLSVS